VIRDHLHHRLSQGRWPPSALSRSRLRHWLANLKRQILARLTNTWTRGLWAGFEALLFRGVSLSLRLDITLSFCQLHFRNRLIFHYSLSTCPVTVCQRFFAVKTPDRVI